MNDSSVIVLGSRSPRRRELLAAAFPSTRLIICPPRDAQEAGFDGLHTLDEFECRLLEIVAVKQRDVLDQLAAGIPLETSPDPGADRFVLCADTTVVVHDGFGGWLALGQPADGPDWRDEVRRWFREYFAGRSHFVLTAVAVVRLSGDRLVSAGRSRVVCSEVTMRSDVGRWLEWYLSTGEPLGKAGGYAVQGAGSVFVTRVEGSLSNVIGLPLEATLELFDELSDSRRFF